MFTDVFSRFIIRDTAIANSDEDNKNKGLGISNQMPLKDKQQMENNPNVYIFRDSQINFFLEKSAFVDFFSVNENRCFFEEKKNELGALIIYFIVKSNLRQDINGAGVLK